MKKLIFLAAIFALPLSVQAGQYASLSGGTDYSNRTDDNNHGQKVGYRLGVSYGYKFGNGFRSEFELSYRDGNKRTVYEFSDGGADKRTHESNHSLSYMANVAYDIGSMSMYGVTPFIGAGVGFCSNTYELKTRIGDEITNKDKANDDRFAWQLIAGAKYPVAEQVDLAMEYKYFCGQYHAKNHSFSAALVRSF